MAIVKICGITNYRDALMSIELGADMLGFNFYNKSKRFISPITLFDIQNKLISHDIPLIVGVFVNSTYEEIRLVLNKCKIDLIQLSGDEPPSLVKKLGENVLKVLRPSSLGEMQELSKLFPARKAVPEFLIDSYSPNSYGGTGNVGNWELLRKISMQHSIMIAGGLNPQNIGSAVKYIIPWGVDVASGVEIVPGQKDVVKIREFVNAAKLI